MPRTHSANLAGKRFGRLLVLRETEHRIGTGHILWEVECDCGQVNLVTSANLISGNTKSCGCLQADRSSACNSGSRRWQKRK